MKNFKLVRPSTKSNANLPNKQNKSINRPSNITPTKSKLYTFCDTEKGKTTERELNDKSIIVKEEDIKKFTHKFAREKVDYEDKILELQDTIVMLRDKKQSLQEEIEELEEQNRKLLVERNDLYECLQYQKQQCKCSQFKAALVTKNEQISTLENQILNLQDYIRNIEPVKGSLKSSLGEDLSNTFCDPFAYDQLMKQYKILQINYDHICEALTIEKQMNNQLNFQLKEMEAQMTECSPNKHMQTSTHSDIQLIKLQEQLKSRQAEWYQKERKWIDEKMCLEKSAKESSFYMYTLKKQVDELSQKSLDKKELKTLVFKHYSEKQQLKKEISRLKIHKE